jgi:Coenzyme PQQ synthesis protein D (PqqD)
MKLKKNIATSESGFVFNPGNGDSFSVNDIGAEILSLMKEDRSLSDITGIITEKYDTEKVQVERDLEDFISLLASFNLIEK